MIVASAPGRLDVMGGIADYSGSLVLQLPLDRVVTVMLEGAPRGRADGEIQVISRRNGNDEEFDWTVDAPIPREPSWAPYVAGVIQWCHEHRSPGARPGGPSGFRLRIKSDVPEGKGVASSAALEVACMKAVAQHWELLLEPEAIAAACQWVENNVVGAPCGIMDQMTSACGKPGHLLKLRCQPATIEGHVAVPEGYTFFGIDSGVRHAVSGADYGSVRRAAFEGRDLIAPGDYLANLTPERFAALEDRLPERIRAATRHPVLENAHVERFAELLERLPADPAVAEELGQLMYASHRSYGDCGLGNVETDRIVAAVAEAGPSRGLFGARITGGGSGGTVAILGRTGAADDVRRIAAGRVVF